MMPAERPALRFVRMLLADHSAERVGDGYEVRRPDRSARLDAATVAELAAIGVLVTGGGLCRTGPRAADWLAAVARQRAGRPAAAPLLAGDESPLARLAASVDGAVPFLETHHVEAGERVRRLVDRARLQQRVTMSYDPARTAGRVAYAGVPEPADSAIDARRQLAEIARLLPSECGGVVFDVCGLLKGLQLVETERGWPRRSAKLVLRIGLEQLAIHFGLAPVAQGREAGRTRGWLDERLPLLG